ncbi:MAG: formyltransferase family protein [Candidatus Omnitrophica bacterium]|nr:formyltransferase family protein [Candidatus Omnitrophota bacterium]
MSGKYKIGWFSTGRGAGSKGMLQAAHDAIRSGELNAEIEFVYCSREYGETEPTDQYLDMVNNYGISLVSYSYQRYRAIKNMPNPDLSQPLPQWRIDYDNEVIKRLEPFHPDLCILAGFMLVTTPIMCNKYEIINLHPAAPGGPAGIWQQVIWKLIETKSITQGIKMHVAIPELDMGPTATYCTFSIHGKAFDKHWDDIKDKTVDEIKATEGVENALFKAIRAHGMVRELPLVIYTLKAFSEGKIKITKDRQVVDAAGRLIDGYDLTQKIDAAVKGKLP